MAVSKEEGGAVSKEEGGAVSKEEGGAVSCPHTLHLYHVHTFPLQSQRQG